MNIQQVIVFATLVLILVLFMWGRWRHDVVAVMALLIMAVSGIVSGKNVFSGFGHPAVITVAAVLVLSRGLLNSGLIDMITAWLKRVRRHPVAQVAVLMAVVMLLSAFMNNIAAIAIMLPVSVQIARKSGYNPSLLLMPLAFGSLLGGLITMIGTPPNIIIALARAKSEKPPFTMFDFTPVGLTVAVAGIIFVSLIGWRLLPKRKGQTSLEENFCVEDYLTEVVVNKDSTIRGKKIRELKKIQDLDFNIIGIVRKRKKIVSPPPGEMIEPGDILIVEADSDDLKRFVEFFRLTLAADEKLKNEMLGSEEMSLNEAVVMSNSLLVGRTPVSMNLRRRFNLNLLAVARKSTRITSRLKSVRFQAGDILLLNGPSDMIMETIRDLGCIPLAPRNLKIRISNRVLSAGLIFLSAILVSAFSILPIQVALTLAVLLMVLTGLVPPVELYENINWSVIVLLGAMIPVGEALETTGGADLIARSLISLASQLPASVLLLILLLFTSVITGVINNAATAVLMAPIAIRVAQGINASPDPFLMAVALGASCAFLTPIGHPSNLLVMGPGGYRFSDYWKLGLPLQVIAAAVGTPAILLVWPL